MVKKTCNLTTSFIAGSRSGFGKDLIPKFYLFIKRFVLRTAVRLMLWTFY